MPTAVLLKPGYSVDRGLDRRTATELWRVSGITDESPATVTASILNAVPVAEGSPHPDPGLVGAICVRKRLVRIIRKHAFTNGEVDAIVAVWYDSERRWGAATFIESENTQSTEESIEVPNYIKITTQGSPNATDYRYAPFRAIRANIIRQENRIASILNLDVWNSTKNNIIAHVGKRFVLFGLPYIMLAPRFIRLPTNQTIIGYRFFQKSSRAKIPASSDTEIDIPALGPLEEYEHFNGFPPTIGVRPLVQYAEGPSVTSLPFWNVLP